MEAPKYKTSKSRSRKRRTHYKITLAKPVKDKDGTYRMPHRINKSTGEYSNKA